MAGYGSSLRTARRVASAMASSARASCAKGLVSIAAAAAGVAEEEKEDDDNDEDKVKPSLARVMR